MSEERARTTGSDRVAVHGLARVVIDRPAGQLAAAMGEKGDWVVRVRRRKDEPWRLACSGDVDSLAVTTDLPRGSSEPVLAGPLTIHPAGRRVVVDDTEVALAKKEFDVLLVLAGDPRRVFTKEELLRAVWGHQEAGGGRTLDSHMSRLRRRLAGAGAEGLVVNCWGIGYSLLPRVGGPVGRSGTEETAGEDDA